MHLVSLYCLLIFIGQHGLFSIRFDEYYDTSEVPLEGLNEFNAYHCHHIGSKCTCSEQCCGTASCVLPAWSLTPLCLVPGYKEDDRLQAIAARDPIRSEDVLYIRNTYNTTFYDFLLNDSSPPVPDNDRTIRTLNDTGDELGSITLKEELNKLFNGPIVSSESDKVPSTDLPYKDVNRFMAPESSEKSQDLEINDSKTTNDSFNMEDSKTNFLRRFKFIILNRTLTKAIRQPKVAEIFEGVKTIDDILTTVKQLTDKLNELKFKEKYFKSNSLDVNTSIARSGAEELSPSLTTNSMNTSIICRKRSKWNIVKSFFLRTNKNNVIPQSRAENSHSQKINLDHVRIDKVSDELKIKNGTRLGGKVGRAKSNLFNVLSDYYSRKSEYMPTDILGNEGSDINSNIESMNDVSGNNIETLKIKIPHQIEHRNDDNLENNNDLAQIPRTILYNDESSSQDSVARTSNDSAIELAQETNSIKKILKSVRHWFALPTKVSISESIGNTYPNDSESNLGSVISENGSVIEAYTKSDSLQSVTKLLTTDDTDHSDSSLDYSESKDDLYNNSYVFMIKRANLTRSKTGSKWKSILHFLHNRTPPRNRDKSENINPGKFVDSSTDTASNLFQDVNINSSSENYQNQRTIRIPEHLMPEALEAKQPNLSELLFSQNSYEEYDG